MSSLVPASPAAIVRPADMNLERLVRLDRKVDAAEGEGLAARWEFGNTLLAEREANGGSKLPNRRLSDLAEATGKSRTEIKYRMQFAEAFPELANALANCGSWFEFCTRPRTASQPAKVKPLPEGAFRVIAADPPWQYDNRATRGAAENHYSTMTLDQVKALEVPDRSAEDAHLYLWTTNGFIREAFEVVEAWGFTYKTCLTWTKPQIGLGNYFRNSTEHILFAIRGKLATQDNTRGTWFQAPRGRHSAKPDCFYDLVEKSSPGPYLEMFSRRRRLGWEAWGDEA